MLRRRDLQLMLDFVERAYASQNLDDYADCVANQLPGLIRCEVASYNEVNPRQRRIRWVITRGASSFPDAERVFEAHMHEHPFICHHRELYRGAVAAKDLGGERRWRRSGIYSDFYHRLRLHSILGVNLPTDPGFIGISPLRADRDFGAREYQILTGLRGHLLQAYRVAELRHERNAKLLLFAHGIDTVGFGAILLRGDGRIGMITTRARQLLARYFATAAREGAALPAILERWLAGTRSRGVRYAAGVIARRTSSRAELGGRVIVDRGRRLIVLSETIAGAPALQLDSFGLAPREAQTLRWLAAGKTDAEIATILAISPRTVSHTLERVYRKLGVENRLAAVLRTVQSRTDGP